MIKSVWPVRSLGALACLLVLASVYQVASSDDDSERIPRIAAIVTAYYHNSHADVIVSRLLQTETLDGKGRQPKLKLVSLYTDQVPKNDKGHELAKQHHVPVYESVKEALTLGTDKLAIDGVLLIAEHGNYPDSPTGQIIYPKRRLFAEIVKVFEQSGRAVPVFSDKHLADNWEDANWIYRNSKRLRFPMMAGSSLPVLWRYPPIDTKRDKPIKELVAVSYHRLDTYGFHALEMIQTLVERRRNGETGVKSVQCLEGEAVWQAGKDGLYDRSLLEEALTRLKERPLRKGMTVEQLAKNPVLFMINYRDGLRASVLTLNGAVVEWASAWRYGNGTVESALFWTQEARPYHHFAYLLHGIEQMMHTGKSTWPVERTLLTSGMLDALLISRKGGGKLIETPQLQIEYQSDWNWRQPLPPPAGRPSREQ